jgi:hypothetical protein
MVMIVKVTGVAPEAISRLHQKIKEGVFCQPFFRSDDAVKATILKENLVRVLNSKFEEEKGTYTVEICIKVKTEGTMRNYAASNHAKRGYYFMSLPMLQELFSLLSWGQLIFPDEEKLVSE